MKKIALLLLVLQLTGCQQNKPLPISQDTTIDSSSNVLDTVNTDVKETTKTLTYANDRFKDVTVKKIAPDKYLVKGKGQIFEASFNWVVEDGHNQLEKGYTMTDAGAPEWGNFEFTITVKKERENSTMTLTLFESSAEDGSPQHELPIPLE